MRRRRSVVGVRADVVDVVVADEVEVVVVLRERAGRTNGEGGISGADAAAARGAAMAVESRFLLSGAHVQEWVLLVLPALLG